MLSLLFMLSVTDTKVPASAAFPHYHWQTVPCARGAYRVRQPLLPGRLGLVQDFGCGLDHLDLDGRRIRVQEMMNTRDEVLRIAIWAVPLEWSIGARYAGACGSAGCDPLVLEVEDIAYPKSHISVDTKFTKPAAAQRARIKRDRIDIDRAFAAGMFDDGALCAELQLDHHIVLPRPPLYTSLFGAIRVINNSNKTTRHLGTDFEGQTGEPIVAAAAGTVVLAQDLYYSGNSVFLSHGMGSFTTYFHMSKLEVKPGQHLRAGELLGKIGRTGRVTGPHLHFSAKMWGTYFDPHELFELEDWLWPLLPPA